MFFCAQPNFSRFFEILWDFIRLSKIFEENKLPGGHFSKIFQDGLRFFKKIRVPPGQNYKNKSYSFRLVVTVCGKSVPMELVVRDQQVNQLYILDKLERQASWALLRCIWSQAEVLLGKRITSSKLPVSILVDALTVPSDSVVDTVNGPMISSGVGVPRPVFPSDFSMSHTACLNRVKQSCNNESLVLVQRLLRLVLTTSNFQTCNATEQRIRLNLPVYNRKSSWTSLGNR